MRRGDVGWCRMMCDIGRRKGITGGGGGGVVILVVIVWVVVVDVRAGV